MENKRMPAIFIGHGSPMLALESSKITHTLHKLGERIFKEFGKPKAILVVSAHWYKSHNLVQRVARPEQIFDMYGFPEALYEVKYHPSGCQELSDEVLKIPGLDVVEDNSWGIDHGTWTPLVHMIPDASVPVVQLSVNGAIGTRGCYEIGRQLAFLRDKGYLVMGSGNIVHNLRMVNWASKGGSVQAEAFKNFIVEAVENRNDEKIIGYTANENAHYAVPTADHFLPLLYVLGSSEDEQPFVYNNVCELDSMAMTGFAFGLTSSE